MQRIISSTLIKKAEMKKAVFQGILIVTLFFGTWYLLAQIKWVTIFNIQKKTENTEQKLGEIFWDVFKKTGKENTNKNVKNTIDSIVNHICETNGINIAKIKIHVLEKNDINAFALPNGHLIVFTGLISQSANQEELAGVICHELAHIELNHVMKKLIQEIGFTVVGSITSGSEGATIIKEATKLLSSSAYDRKLEKEADIKAVDLMVEANINPKPFADFLYKMSDKETIKQFTWISTHPDSKERGNYILSYCKTKSKQYRQVVTAEGWFKMQQELKKSE